MFSKKILKGVIKIAKAIKRLNFSESLTTEELQTWDNKIQPRIDEYKVLYGKKHIRY